MPGTAKGEALEDLALVSTDEVDDDTEARRQDTPTERLVVGEVCARCGGPLIALSRAERRWFARRGYRDPVGFAHRATCALRSRPAHDHGGSASRSSLPGGGVR